MSSSRRPRSRIAVAALVAALAVAAHAQRPTHQREPASKSAAILFWPEATRERYIAALDQFFLTRRVKAGSRPHVLDAGHPIAAFEPGGPRADVFRRFMTVERVHGVLVLQFIAAVQAEVDAEAQR